MLQKYSVMNGRIVQGTEGSIQIEVYIMPDEAERTRLINDYEMNEHTIASSIDPDETPRIEFEDNHTAIIVKYPKNYSADDNFLFRVKSMGIFVFKDKVIIIIDEYVPLFTGKIANNVHTVQDVIMKTLLLTIRHFESHLRVINMCSDEIEHEINKSCENKNLLNMFTLEKGLVYYVNALNGNRRVIERMKVNAQKFGFTEENIELLDDLAIPVNQIDVDTDKTGLVELRLDDRLLIRGNFSAYFLSVVALALPAEEESVGLLISELGLEGVDHLFAGLVGKRGFIGFSNDVHVGRIKVCMADERRSRQQRRTENTSHTVSLCLVVPEH